jgi:hypothetical protein
MYTICENSYPLELIQHERQDKIILIQQFYLHSDKERNKEIKFSLMKNTENKYIDKIILLNERIYTNEELGISNKKIIQYDIKSMLTFANVFYYTKKLDLNGYIVFSNSDIVIGKSVKIVKKTKLHQEKLFISLLRYEIDGKIYGPYSSTQDTWVFHTQQNIDLNYLKMFDFYFDVPACDHYILYCIKHLNYNIINCPNEIKTYHIHKETTRNYEYSTYNINYYFSKPLNLKVLENNYIYKSLHSTIPYIRNKLKENVRIFPIHNKFVEYNSAIFYNKYMTVEFANNLKQKYNIRNIINNFTINNVYNIKNHIFKGLNKRICIISNIYDTLIEQNKKNIFIEPFFDNSVNFIDITQSYQYICSKVINSDIVIIYDSTLHYDNIDMKLVDTLHDMKKSVIVYDDSILLQFGIYNKDIKNKYPVLTNYYNSDLCINPNSYAPKRVFIIPYRNRNVQLNLFMNHMRWIFKEMKWKYGEDYSIVVSHQKDERSFNRGGMRNLGFEYIKQKYPLAYKDIVFIFNDVDTFPTQPYILGDYWCNRHEVIQYYGHENNLGGIVGICGLDFEQVNGYPNLWKWGGEDNIFYQRCKILKVNKNYKYNLNSKYIIYLSHIEERTNFITINYNKYIKNIINKSKNNGIHSLRNIEYNIEPYKIGNQQFDMVNFTSFDVDNE